MYIMSLMMITVMVMMIVRASLPNSPTHLRFMNRQIGKKDLAVGDDGGDDDDDSGDNGDHDGLPAHSHHGGEMSVMINSHHT